MNEFNFKKNFLIKLTAFSLIFLLSMIIFIDILSDAEYKKTLESIQSTYQRDLKNKNTYIEYRFQEVQKDLIIMKELLDRTSIKENKAGIEKLFKELIEQKEYYSQIRYINNTGKEQIRLNKFGNGFAYVVSDPALQNKEDSYYFCNSIAMEENEIFVSPLDLNVEHGGVTIPYEPTIRFSTVIYNQNHEKAGVLIVNYLGDSILNNFRIQSTNIDSQFILTNKKGYYLKHPDGSKEFSFMFSTRSHNLYDDFPELKEKITNQSQTAIENDQGLFIYKKINPLNHPIDRIKLNSQDYYWHGIIHIPAEALEMLKSNIRSQYVENNTYTISLGLLIIIALSYSLTLNQEYKHNLKINANYDTMTQLYNRRMAMKRLKQEIKRVHSLQNDLTIMFLDLDNLKKVNDQLGHSVGDELIVQMGKILLKVIRRHDIAARIGGDEYLVILTDCNEENAFKVKQRINEKIAAYNERSKKSFELSVSIGIKAYDDSLSYDEFVQAADKKMYEEKNQSKNKGERHE